MLCCRMSYHGGQFILLHLETLPTWTNPVSSAYCYFSCVSLLTNVGSHFDKTNEYNNVTRQSFFFIVQNNIKR